MLLVVKVEQIKGAGSCASTDAGWNVCAVCFAVSRQGHYLIQLSDGRVAVIGECKGSVRVRGIDLVSKAEKERSRRFYACR